MSGSVETSLLLPSVASIAVDDGAAFDHQSVIVSDVNGGGMLDLFTAAVNDVGATANRMSVVTSDVGRASCMPCLTSPNGAPSSVATGDRMVGASGNGSIIE